MNAGCFMGLPLMPVSSSAFTVSGFVSRISRINVLWAFTKGLLNDYFDAPVSAHVPPKIDLGPVVVCRRVQKWSIEWDPSWPRLEAAQRRRPTSRADKSAV